MSQLVAQEWRLKEEVVGLIGPQHFAKHQTPLPPLRDGDVLCSTLWLSFDPAQRTWLTKGSYMKQVTPGDVMQAGGLARVVESRSSRYAAGDLVTGLCGWRDRFVFNAGDAAATANLHKMPPLSPGTPLELTQSLLGTTGLTAFFGIDKIGEVKRGDVVVVSGAAGATGSVAGQLARVRGASRVVGIAGGPEKCRYLVEELGFDAAIDYKQQGGRIAKELRRHCPKGLDVFFDNVGGEALEAALQCLRPKARVVLCGGISQYNPQSPADMKGPSTYLSLIGASARMEVWVALTRHTSRKAHTLAFLRN